MGYYDSHIPKREDNRKKRASGLSAFFGAIVGAVIVLVSIPALSQTGLLPYDISTNQNETVPTMVEGEPAGLEQTVNLSVNSDITNAVDKVSDAVVGVINLQETNFWSNTGGEGTGSGVIYKQADGKAFVVTNHHVIEGAREVEVSLTDGTRVPAKVLGTDVLTDLAVLEIDDEGVTAVAEFGNSETLRVGEPAVAIGNPLGLAFSSTVTQGIISATERSIPVDLTGNGQIDWHAEVLQTDAAINPGNSGGALLNIQGQVIGINSMKIAQSSVEGIGFAIPTAIAVPVINDLERFSEVRRPQMGVGIRSLSEIPGYHWQETLKLPDEVKAGVFVTSVAPVSPAERAGLQEYDVIVKINDRDIEDGHDLRKFLYTETEIGDEITVTFYREGSKQTTTITLSEQQAF
ncbi:trypsin-like peptidase domain-containing protein [Alkalihalobacillus sp. LMS39]|uniref:S1C family serine protease n=1 Tax=Alkalihalobacillus sp. LMS39 TaxID=2924032 RepID=UPI001FB23A34|nr:trypsin-like peptidase domain-containing protein [Alkalihalobacillus sp. LMS39]UOE94112.1 trypsin-like peptidase domain-containing protein [Alkalihalobacillus sp. LMS39]